MKMRRIIISVLLLVVMAVALVGCGENDNNYHADVLINGNVVANTADRLIVYTASISITVDDIQASEDIVIAKLGEVGGYQQSKYDSSDYKRYTFRVPTDKLNGFLACLNNLSGEVTYSDITSEDITEKYIGAESRRDALQKEKEMLESILETTTDVSDVIYISDKIFDISLKIDELDKDMSSFRKSADYSTVYLTLNLSEKSKQPSFGQELIDVLADSVEGVGELFKFLLKLIVAVLPYAVVAGIVFGLVVLIVFVVCKIRHKPFSLFGGKKTQEEKKKEALEKLNNNK